MKWEYIGTGLGIVGIGITLLVALPPPWWPKMPSVAVHVGVLSGLILALVGAGIIIFGVVPNLPMPKIGALPATAAIALFLVAAGFYVFTSDDAYNDESFKTTVYSVFLGDSSIGTDKEGKPAFISNNPVILLLRIDNTGTKASSLGGFTLTANEGGDVFVAKRYLIPATIHFSKNIAISPKSDLRFKQDESVAPGNSLAGALYFVFSDKPPAFLKNPSVSLKLTFEDIYSNKYEVSLKKPSGPSSEEMVFPGITYE